MLINDDLALSPQRDAHLFGMDSDRLRRAKPDILLLAPGPINRGVEVTPEVADGPHSAILQQVTNGLAVRMAVLDLLCGRHPASFRAMVLDQRGQPQPSLLVFVGDEQIRCLGDRTLRDAAS